MRCVSLASVGAVAAAVAVAQIGCRPGEEAEQRFPDLDEQAVTHAADLPRLPLEEVVRIGSLEDPNVGFSRIANVRFAPDGRIYVLDSNAREVRVFERDGRLVRRIGGKGSGPGELGDGGRIQFGLLGDTVWLRHDGVGLPRFTLFTTAGTLISTVPVHTFMMETSIEGLLVPVSPRWDGLRPDGLFESQASLRPGAGANAGVDSVDVPLVLFDETGEVADTVGYERWSTAPINWEATAFHTPVIDSPMAAAIDGDSLFVFRPFPRSGSEGMLAILRVTASGDTVFARGLRYRPRRLDGAFRDSVAEVRWRLLASARQEADTSAMIRELRSRIDFPPYEPALRGPEILSPEYLERPYMGLDLIGAIVGVAGRVWLRLSDAAGEANRFVVLEADGTVLGEILLPERNGIVRLDGDEIWTVEHDEFDVPWIVHYRIARG